MVVCVLFDSKSLIRFSSLPHPQVKFSDHKTYSPTDCNHVFINFVPVVEMDPIAYLKELDKMIKR